MERSALVALEKRCVFPPYSYREGHAAAEPLVIARAEGVYLYDADGRRYLDANASWWTACLGHGHPRVRQVLADRGAAGLLHVAYAGAIHEDAVLLADALLAAAPRAVKSRPAFFEPADETAPDRRLARVFFSDDGSTAVEVALKLALQYFAQTGEPKRRRFLALAGAFHGDTTGAMSVSGLDVFRAHYGPMLFDVVRPPAPEPAAHEGWVEAVERAIERDAPTLAAVVIEPVVQAAAGMHVYDPVHVRRIAEAARRVGALVVFDEVFTGYGRTGTMWAADAVGVVPDILCTSKGLTAGTLPLAATLVTEPLYDAFSGHRARSFMHGHTFFGNPLGCAIAREVLAVFGEERVLARAEPRAAMLAEGFAALGVIPGVRHVRSVGMVAACDLALEGGGVESGWLGELGWRVYHAARARGVHLRPLGDTVYVTPPLTITEDELAELLTVVRASVAEVLGARR